MQLSRLQALTMLHDLIDKDIEDARGEYEDTVKKLDVIRNRLLEKNREKNVGLGEAWFSRKEKADKAKEHLITCLERKLALLDREEKE